MSNQGRNHPDDDFVERIARPLRTPEHARESFEDSLIAAIRAEEPLPRLVPRHMRRLSRAWWSATTIHLTPIAGLALAAGIAGVAAVITRTTASSNAAIPAAAAAPAVVASTPVRDTVTFVRFVFVGHASSVALVGDFNGWGGEPVALDQSASGAWTASIPLTNGRHEYAFIVDGERWVADPLVPSNSDDFDTHSSVITVGT